MRGVEIKVFESQHLESLLKSVDEFLERNEFVSQSMAVYKDDYKRINYVLTIAYIEPSETRAQPVLEQ